MSALKICPTCNRRRQLGRCKFGGPNVVHVDHCRGCCAAPERDRWSPSAARPEGQVAGARSSKTAGIDITKHRGV